MDQFNLAKGTNSNQCQRCGDEKPLNRYGVCTHCDDEIEAEYMDLYSLSNMESQ